MKREYELCMTVASNFIIIITTNQTADIISKNVINRGTAVNMGITKKRFTESRNKLRR